MKVLFMIPTLSVGGAEKVLVNLVNLLNKQQFNITVMTLFDGGINRKFLGSDVKYISCFKHQIRGNSHILKLFPPKKLYTLLVKEQYDIIVSYLEGPTARIVSGCPDVKSKLVSWIHCTMHNKEEFAVGFRNYNEAKLCYEKYDRCIFVSKEGRDTFVNIFPEMRDKTLVCNNLVNDKKILELSKEKIELEKEKNIVTFVNVGRHDERQKKLSRLIEASKKLNEENYKFKVLLIGDGQDTDMYKEMVEKNNLQEKVQFVGRKQNPYPFLCFLRRIFRK